MSAKRFFTFASLLVIAGLLLVACGAEATATVAPAVPTDTIAVTMPTETMGAMPTETMGAMPTETMGTMPTETMGTMPTETMGAMPTETMGAGATAMPTGTMGGPTSTPAATLSNPPEVANADAAKQYSGTTITYYGGQVGLDHDTDVALADKFSQATGITINIVQRPASSSDTYSTYQRFFQAQSQDIDVMMLDVIWPGAFAPYLLDLTSTLGSEVQADYPGIVAGDTINGQLVAVPWFSDFGILYYRTDLLQKYNISAPPTTWDELQQDAMTIQQGEQASNPNFVGFVFQGTASEALTCDALEWLASNGSGYVDSDGTVTINNDAAVSTMQMAQGWVGTIAPKGVTTYAEEDARNVFQGGNAAFMRNWPYAYAAAKAPDANGNMSPIANVFDVAPLPHGPNGESSGTVGGWALGVSKFSAHPEASIEWVRYLHSEQVQVWRNIVGGYVPVNQQAAQNPAVLAASPFLTSLADVQRVARPSALFGANYNQASTAIFQAVNQILNGADPKSQLDGAANQLNRLLPTALNLRPAGN